MKKFAALLLILAMCFTLTACGDSQELKATRELITAIGEVSLDSEEAIIAAENAYNALTEEDKAKVENYAELTAAREKFEILGFVGEWTDIYGYGQYTVTLKEDGTFTASDGFSGEFTLTENGINLGGILELERIDHNGKVRLVNDSGDSQSEYVRAEDAATSEHEINSENWQEYFDFAVETVPQKNGFDELDRLEYYFTLKLKEEYVSRLVNTDYNSKYTVSYEVKYTLKMGDASLDETGESVTLISNHWSEDRTDTYTNTQNSYFTYYHNRDTFSTPDGFDYSNTLIGYQMGGVFKDESGWYANAIENEELTRIKGTMLFYDEPMF